MPEPGQLSTPEVAGVVAVALVLIRATFEVIKSMLVKNGHAQPARASVAKADAPEFWLLSNETLQRVQRLQDSEDAATLERARIAARLDDIHSLLIDLARERRDG